MTLLLRALLGLIGVVIVLLGVNVGFGGIATLGLQGPTDFISIEDADAFAVQDNHVRFLGGVWLGAGLLFIASAFYLTRLKGPLLALFAMIFIGGIARLSAADPALLMSANIAPSLLAELVLFPALAFWVHKAAD